jgi:hypothetical protein
VLFIAVWRGVLPFHVANLFCIKKKAPKNEERTKGDLRPLCETSSLIDGPGGVPKMAANGLSAKESMGPRPMLTPPLLVVGQLPFFEHLMSSEVREKDGRAHRGSLGIVARPAKNCPGSKRSATAPGLFPHG